MSNTYKAGGNINPSRIVTLSGDDFHVIQAVANSEAIGIAQEGTREAPIPSVATALAAQDDDSLKVYTQGDRCLLEISATVAIGDRLKSDADGKGTPITGSTTAKQNVIAIAQEGGAANDLIRVEVTIDSVAGTFATS